MVPIKRGSTISYEMRGPNFTRRIYSPSTTKKWKVKAISSATDGQTVAVVNVSCKLITDFATWVQYINLYAAVVISTEQKWVKNLLAYMSLMVK